MKGGKGDGLARVLVLPWALCGGEVEPHTDRPRAGWPVER